MSPATGLRHQAQEDNQEATDEITATLDYLSKTQTFLPVATALRRILHGDRGDDLFGDLDEDDTAVIKEVLARLSNTPP